MPKCRSIVKKAISVLIQMPITYLCESGFSCLCEIKSCKRNSIIHSDPLMRRAIKKDITPRFGMLVDIICNNKKVIKDNFLNLLCALSCAILSADCNANVFLDSNFDVAFCLISNFKHGVHELVIRFFRVHHNKKG